MARAVVRWFKVAIYRWQWTKYAGAGSKVRRKRALPEDADTPHPLDYALLITRILHNLRAGAGPGVIQRVGGLKPCLNSWKPLRGWPAGREQVPGVLLGSPSEAATS